MTFGRIPCINPNCRRTAAADKHPHSSEICCYQCWKLLPKRLTARYRSLRRRGVKMIRRAEQRIAKGEAVETFHPVFDRLGDRYAANWEQIRDYFLAPPAPEGLENFLAEVGLG